MIQRVYTWEVILPGGRDPQDALQAAQKAAERVSTYNPMVEDAWVVLTDEGALQVSVHHTGKDQWWVKRKVVYAIGAILAQSKIPRTHAQLISVLRPQDLRSTRQRASDGRHNPIPEDQDIDHSDMGLVIT